MPDYDFGPSGQPPVDPGNGAAPPTQPASDGATPPQAEGQGTGQADNEQQQQQLSPEAHARMILEKAPQEVQDFILRSIQHQTAQHLHSKGWRPPADNDQPPQPPAQPQPDPLEQYLDQQVEELDRRLGPNPTKKELLDAQKYMLKEALTAGQGLSSYAVEEAVNKRVAPIAGELAQIRRDSGQQEFFREHQWLEPFREDLTALGDQPEELSMHDVAKFVAKVAKSVREEERKATLAEVKQHIRPGADGDEFSFIEDSYPRFGTGDKQQAAKTPELRKQILDAAKNGNVQERKRLLSRWMRK
jgi:hypothetical protein